MLLTTLPTTLIALLPLATATAFHRSIPRPRAIEQEQPLATPSPVKWQPTETYKKRGVISDISGDVNSILGSLGSDIPSYVASGVPNFFQNFPSGASVQSSLGLNDSQVSALPTQVLNIPWDKFLTPAFFSWLTIVAAMETGLIRAGACDFTAMSSSNRTSPKTNSTTWQMSS